MGIDEIYSPYIPGDLKHEKVPDTSCKIEIQSQTKLKFLLKYNLPCFSIIQGYNTYITPFFVFFLLLIFLKNICVFRFKVYAWKAESYEQPQCFGFKPVRRCFSMVQLRTASTTRGLPGIVRLCKSLTSLAVDGVSKGTTLL